MTLFRFQNRQESERRLIRIGEVFGQKDDALLKKDKQDTPESADKDKDAQDPKKQERQKEKDDLHRSVENPQEFQKMIDQMRGTRVETAKTDTKADAARIVQTNKQVARLENQSAAANAGVDAALEVGTGPAGLAMERNIRTENLQPKNAVAAGNTVPNPEGARVQSARVETARQA
jgi:hypothetical protein